MISQRHTAFPNLLNFSGISPRTPCDAAKLMFGPIASFSKMPLSRNISTPALEQADDIRSGR